MRTTATQWNPWWGYLLLTVFSFLSQPNTKSFSFLFILVLWSVPHSQTIIFYLQKVGPAGYLEQDPLVTKIIKKKVSGTADAQGKPVMIIQSSHHLKRDDEWRCAALLTEGRSSSYRNREDHSLNEERLQVNRLISWCFLALSTYLSWPLELSLRPKSGLKSCLHCIIWLITDPLHETIPIIWWCGMGKKDFWHKGCFHLSFLLEDPVGRIQQKQPEGKGSPFWVKTVPPWVWI